MISKEYKKDRLLFISAVKKLMTSMGLKILEHGIDYNVEKPDIVAIYPDKQKYYMIEVICEGCLASPSARIYTKDACQEYRIYCKKLFDDDEISAAIAAGIICDLASGVEAFNFKTIGTYTLNSMSRYGAVAVPIERTDAVSNVLEKLGLDFRTLDILDDFTLVLISKEDTIRLPETKKFINFILSNR